MCHPVLPIKVYMQLFLPVNLTTWRNSTEWKNNRKYYVYITWWNHLLACGGVPLTWGCREMRCVSISERCPHFRGWHVQRHVLIREVSSFQRAVHVCTGFNGVGTWRCVPIREVSSFRGWYVQTSVELGPEDVSLLERCPHFRRCMASLYLKSRERERES